MRYVTIVLLLGIIFLLSATQVLAAVPDVVINEVHISGGTGHTDDDFVELYNATDQSVDISGWKMKKRIKSGTESTLKDFSVAEDMNITIPAKKYLLWASANGKFKTSTEEEFISSSSLTSDNSLALFDENNILIDAVTYGAGHTNPFAPSLSYPLNPTANSSIERDMANNLFVAQVNPTPQNDSAVAETPVVEDVSEDKIDDTVNTQGGTVRINELFPNPKEKGEASEFIELYNFGAEDIDLAGFVLRDASSTGKYILPAGSLLPKQAYFLVTREKSKLSLNNSDESVSLFDPAGELLDTVTYATSKEGASLSYAASGYRWSKYLTPGAVNEFSEVPQIEKTDIPKKAYPNMPVLFSAKGGADEAVVYLWDFGDGVKSRKQNTSHVYKKKGKYAGSLTITGSLESSVKNFTVQVKKMPQQKISITA
ncbi:MAG: lamin tail domain-containing protein, partial [Parcubacteria group bacterium]